MTTTRKYLVQLDLTEDADYSALVTALEAAISEADGRAEDESGPQCSHHEDEAARVQRMLDSIEAQIDASATTPSA